MLNAKLMGFEQVKEQYANDSYFANVVVECAKGACDGFFMHEVFSFLFFSFLFSLFLCYWYILNRIFL
jgi:hypothetical protein